MVENEVLSDFESSSYVLSETFYGIKKAFSIVVQWRDKVGNYAHFFRKMYGKVIIKNLDFFYLKKLFFWLQIIFENPFLIWWFHLVSYTNVIWEFLRF